MREILFRGKDIGTEKWIYGHFVPDIQEIYRDGIAPWWGWVFPLGTKEHDEIHRRCVHRKSVCQYTGIKDKNGMYIFEKDIVSNGEDDGVVMFFSGSYWIKSLTSLRDYQISDMVRDWKINWWITGNICDKGG